MSCRSQSEPCYHWVEAKPRQAARLFFFFFPSLSLLGEIRHNISGSLSLSLDGRFKLIGLLVSQWNNIKGGGKNNSHHTAAFQMPSTLNERDNPWTPSFFFTRGTGSHRSPSFSTLWKGRVSVKGDRRTNGDHGSYFIGGGRTGRPWELRLHCFLSLSCRSKSLSLG